VNDAPRSSLPAAVAPAMAELAGVPVTTAPAEQVLAAVNERIASGEAGGVVSITNTESMYHALRNAAHMAFIRRAQHSLCDGVGVVAAGWFWV